MADDKLVLHPQDPRAILHDPTLVLDALRSSGLIGGSFGWYGENHYAAGPRYRELVLFRRFAEPEERELHVSLSETSEEPAFLGATYAQPPFCPGCRGVFPDWRAQILAWQRDNYRRPWNCARCGNGVEVSRLDWAHTGGIARYSLDLWGIRQGAAIPSAGLLGLLERVTLEQWNYFYYRLGNNPAPRVPPRVQPS
jgi:hypothetical protein